MRGLGEPLAKVCLGESIGKQVKIWGHDSPEVLGETVSEILRSVPGGVLIRGASGPCWLGGGCGGASLIWAQASAAALSRARSLEHRS